MKNRYAFYIVLLQYTVLNLLPISGSSAWAGQVESSIFVTLQADRLTVKVSNASIDKVLHEIARLTGIRMYGEPSLPTEKLFVEFNELTVEDGLMKVLSSYNFTFISSREVTNPHRIEAVWIFLKDAQDYLPEKQSNQIHTYDIPTGHNILPDMTRDASELGKSQNSIVIPELGGPESAVKFEVDGLDNFDNITSRNQNAMIDLERADPEARIAILTSDIVLPREVVIKHALYDPSPFVRIEAIQSLEGDNQISDIAREALNDPDPSVRAVAMDILQVLNEENTEPQLEVEDN